MLLMALWESLEPLALLVSLLVVVLALRSIQTLVVVLASSQ